ncbi:MAG: ribosome biogenesis GTP-binding protein YihA/YsxC [Halofilum sp. (in: g-proteobacteria)]|nr:ribosome biogenesis GTP-binding protein YihA/YsxC [Halofilum sp. (in: g-proteobacteria)]
MSEVTQRYARAAFHGSCARLAQLPPDRGREAAFAGRSNAGKSSALNAITRRRNLARTSRTPGRTQLINVFDLGDERRLVDLPGYGYAKAPETARRNWERLVAAYLTQRTSLAGIVLVLDARRGLTELDWRLLELVAPTGAALHVLLTKSDKLERAQARRALESERAGAGSRPASRRPCSCSPRARARGSRTRIPCSTSGSSDAGAEAKEAPAPARRRGNHARPWRPGDPLREDAGRRLEWHLSTWTVVGAKSSPPRPTGSGPRTALCPRPRRPARSGARATLPPPAGTPRNMRGSAVVPAQRAAQGRPSGRPG